MEQVVMTFRIISKDDKVILAAQDTDTKMFHPVTASGTESLVGFLNQYLEALDK